MKLEELKSNLQYLINKYVIQETLKNQLIDEIKRTDMNELGVKGILHEVNNSSDIKDPKDLLLIKEIVFNYC